LPPALQQSVSIKSVSFAKCDLSFCTSFRPSVRTSLVKINDSSASQRRVGDKATVRKLGKCKQSEADRIELTGRKLTGCLGASLSMRDQPHRRWIADGPRLSRFHWSACQTSVEQIIFIYLFKLTGYTEQKTASNTMVFVARVTATVYVSDHVFGVRSDDGHSENTEQFKKNW
jgi:hypothetical protein